MAATAEKPAAPRTAIAVIAPPRLPYAEGTEERFGIDRSAWKALCESVFPTAKTSGAIILALSYCRARKLDPFKKPVHIVPIYDSQKREYVESVWPGIGEHRTTAFRTGTYAGMDVTLFGEEATETFKDKVRDGQAWKTAEAKVTFPSWAQVTVYRMVQGQRVAFPGPRVYWREFYSRQGRSIIPNDRWQKAPFQMIEKCAEAGALRRAFPEELGEDWTADEAGFFGASDPKDITPASEQPAVPAQEPTRAQFRPPATDVEHDPETGEIETESPAPPAGDAPGGAAAASHPAPQPPGEPRDWRVPIGMIDEQVQAFADLYAAAETSEDLLAVIDQNAALLNKWRAAKPGSAWAKAREAVESAHKARADALAAA